MKSSSSREREPRRPTRSSILAWVLLAIIAAGTLSFTYWVTSLGFYEQISGGDDRNLFEEGRHFAAHPLDLLNINYVSDSALTSTHYMPMYYGYFAILSQISGESAFAYHIFGFLFHALNALLIFIMIYIFTRSKWSSLSGFCIFLLFPGNIETLRWVSAALNHPPVVFFLLTTLLSYIKFRERGSKLWYILTVVFALLGCLNKQSFYPFFTILIAYDVLMRQSELDARSFVRRHAAFVLMGFVFLIIQHYRYDLGWIHQFKGGVLFHPIIVIRLLDFAKSFLWPYPTHGYLIRFFLITVTFLIGLITLVHSKNRAAKLAICWIFFLGISAMTQNLRSIIENIRYTYIMLPGFALFVGAVSKKKNYRIIPLSIIALFLLGTANAYL
jgi:hypothetical protein